MLIPDIIFHPMGKIVDETCILLTDYDEDFKGQSMFEELKEVDLPTYSSA
jgi:hypothetical protein